MAYVEAVELNMNISILNIQQHKWFRTLGLAAVMGILAYVLGKAALEPGKVRLLLAASIIVVLTAFSQKKPTLVMYLLLIYLPFLGFIRRVLIPMAGWNSMDPFVIVGPAMIIFLATKWLYDTYLRREPIENDSRLFKLVRFMLVIDLLQVVNPLQGSLMTGVAGIMFYIAPICYMILARRHLDERKMRIITGTVFAIGVIISIYGYKQFFFGYSSFENMWVELSGYTALKVYSITRPISTFTSASEYAHYLGVTAVIGWVYFLKSRFLNKLFALAGVMLIYSALFIASARGIIFTATAAMTVISIMSVKSMFQKVVITLAACAALGGLFVGISKLNTDNDLIYHSVVGLTDPLGEESTTVGHWHLMIEGFRKGITNPLGHGLGSTTIAAGKFSGNAVSSEVDLSNKFLATGLLGGGAFLLILLRTMGLAFKHARRSTTHLIILGVLLAEGGQWLNGGHYSLVGLIWIMIGYLDKTSVAFEADSTQEMGKPA
jgi:hypothetical protein